MDAKSSGWIVDIESRFHRGLTLVEIKSWPGTVTG